MAESDFCLNVWRKAGSRLPWRRSSSSFTVKNFVPGALGVTFDILTFRLSALSILALRIADSRDLYLSF